MKDRGLSISLIEDGRSAYTIVVAEDAVKPVRFAAEELQKYLKLISGAQLPASSEAANGLAICVGESKLLAAEIVSLRAQLNGRSEDGYLMRSIGKRIVLLGNSPRATLYAVYHFLEKYLGCGWCAPGDDTVPRRETVQLPQFDDAVGPPALPMRQIILYPYGGSWLKRNNFPHTDWLTKNRFNWAHPAQNGPYSWERNKSREVFVPEVEKRGLYLEVGGHTFNTWLPHDQYAKDHPDYFAVAEDGTRATDGTHKAGLCISNPEVIRQVAENISKWLDENPEVDAVDLWHNDSYTYCRCPNCTPTNTPKDQSPVLYTEKYIQFVNRVAAAVARRHPKVLVNLLAYAHTTVCPPDGQQLADNVLVGLCLFPRPSQSTMRPLETSAQPLDSKLRLQIRAWRRLAKHFYIYEYYTIGEQYKRWTMVSMICEDIPFLKRLGVDGMSSDQWGPGWYPLNMYAFGKLTWNPDLKADEIIADFCNRYYGDASQTMIAYWGLLEEGLRESWSSASSSPINWRDDKRRELVKKALSEAHNKQIEDRIRATAALHKLDI